MAACSGRGKFRERVPVEPSEIENLKTAPEMCPRFASVRGNSRVQETLEKECSAPMTYLPGSDGFS